MAYVPPALRCQKENQVPASPNTRSTSFNPAHTKWLTTTSEESDVFHLPDVLAYYWPSSQQPRTEIVGVKGQAQDPQSTADDSGSPYRDQDHNPIRLPHVSAGAVKVIHSTLNACEKTPDRLSFIVLFRDANPQFYDEGLIFVKSHLELLKGASKASVALTHETDVNAQAEGAATTTDDLQQDLVQSGSTAILRRNPAIGTTVAIFDQAHAAISSSESTMRFLGHYTVDDVRICAPHSDELYTLLEKKWTLKDRGGKTRQVTREPHAWQYSFAQEWAHIRVLKDEEYTKQRGPPKIEKLHHEERRDSKPTKAVSEMLKEMRLIDGKP